MPKLQDAKDATTALKQLIEDNPKCCLIYTLDSANNFRLCAIGSTSELLAMDQLGAQGLQDMLRKVSVTGGEAVH